MTILLSPKIQQHFKTNVFQNKKKESENQKERLNFKNSSFQFESPLVCSNTHSGIFCKFSFINYFSTILTARFF